MRSHRIVFAVGLLSSAASVLGQTHASGTSPDARAAATSAALTPEEKIALLHGPMPSLLASAKRLAGVPIGAGYIRGVPRLGIPVLAETDASLGVSNLNDMRKGDVATALPSGLALASSWDPLLARTAGAMIGSEARAKGFNVMLVGGVNLTRDPRGGRNFEYLGEDPLLAGTLVGGQIAGVQSNHMIATIKHFAVNDIETGRNFHSVELAEAPMRESDLLAFEIGIEKGDPGAVMCGYNRVNAVYACQNPFLLNEVLRRDWGFKGFVLSDWGAVHSSEAILAGLDQQSGEQVDGKRWFSDLMVQALGDGRVSQAAIDTSVQRILRTMYAHGLVDLPVTTGGAIDYDTHAAVAQATAEAGIVLLRNEGNILPLPATARSIVVIGGHADIGVLSGGGSSQVRPVGGFALEQRQHGTGPASFARRSYMPSSPLAALKAACPGARIDFVDGTDVAVATAAAKGADIAIVFAEKWATEAADQKDLALEGNADALIAAVAAANPRTIVVLETGNPVTMPWRDRVPAIVAAWFPGERGGEAIARILTGAVNPSGHLPMTFPAAADQLPNPVLPGSEPAAGGLAAPSTYGVASSGKMFSVRYPEGSDVGYRWYDRRGLTPLYAFGHGLSYTRFRYGALNIRGGETLAVRFSVTNVGRRAGTDVPQVYVRRPGKAKRLIGWGRPTLTPGETRTVEVIADPRILGDYDTVRHRWVVPAGTYTIEVGTSATDTVMTGRAMVKAKTLKP